MDARVRGKEGVVGTPHYYPVLPYQKSQGGRGGWLRAMSLAPPVASAPPQHFLLGCVFFFFFFYGMLCIFGASARSALWCLSKAL